MLFEGKKIVLFVMIMIMTRPNRLSLNWSSLNPNPGRSGWGGNEAVMKATCLFTRLEKSSLVPEGFLTAQFLQKTYFTKPFCGGGGRMVWCFSSLPSWGKRKY